MSAAGEKNSKFSIGLTLVYFIFKSLIFFYHGLVLEIALRNDSISVPEKDLVVEAFDNQLSIQLFTAAKRQLRVDS